MRKLAGALERGLMLILAVIPVALLLFRSLLADINTGIIWFVAQTFIASLAGMLPAYVGNYKEIEVVRYEGSRGSDPNPDREAVHELIKEGHRFPVRLPAAILLMFAGIVLSVLLPQKVFATSEIGLKLGFCTMMFALNAIALYGAASYNMFTEIPGMIAGFVVYLFMAVYMQFSKADNSDIQLIISICALVYLFVGCMGLNRAVLGNSVSSGEKKGVPRQIVLRNRRIVGGFALIAAVVSFVEPIRDGAIWLWGKLSELIKMLGDLLRGGPAQEVSMEELLQMMGPSEGADAGLVMETAEESGGYWLVYVFLGFVAIGLVWILFDGLRRLIKRLSKLIEGFAAGMSEGYYDERAVIGDEDEARSRLTGSAFERLKKLLARETPWEKLSARDKTRRMLRNVYERRGRRIKGLRAKTANEALLDMKLDGTKLGKLYDMARYSEHEIAMDEAESLRKEIKP